MIESRKYEVDTPEWVMARFFECWKNRAWKQMIGYVQPCWLHQYKDPSRMLRLTLHKLINADFVQVNAKTGVVSVFAMSVRREIYSIPTQSHQTVRLVREGKKWAVDPKSII